MCVALCLSSATGAVINDIELRIVQDTGVLINVADDFFRTPEAAAVEHDVTTTVGYSKFGFI